MLPTRLCSPAQTLPLLAAAALQEPSISLVPIFPCALLRHVPLHFSTSGSMQPGRLSTLCRARFPGGHALPHGLALAVCPVPHPSPVCWNLLGTSSGEEVQPDAIL